MSADLAAWLAEVREAAALLAKTNAPSWGTVPRIRRMTGYAEHGADAVEAVLNLHRPGRYVIQGSVCKRHESYPFFSITSTEAGHVTACSDCSAVVYVSCTGCAGSPDIERCTTRAAISAALTGEDGVSAGFREQAAELMDQNDGLLRRLADGEDGTDDSE